MLNLLLIIPAIGALGILLLPHKKSNLIRNLSLVVSLITFILSLTLLFQFDSQISQMQFIEDKIWFEVGPVSVHYHIGIDGLSLFLVLLTTFLFPISILASWHIKKNISSYMSLLLLLEMGIIGVFISLDLILFYVFWEVTLIPMYFLIGIWGGKQRIYATVKFFIYTMASSLLMLAAIIPLYFLNPSKSFNLIEITNKLVNGEIILSPSVEILLFLAFFLAFAVKIPLFPLHTWLPDAHVEAPTAGSVILAGVLLKMGTYGLLRFCIPLFPKASLTLAPIISILAIIGIIYGSLIAMVQPDMKKLVAYSSISHLGFVVLGIFSFNLISIEGATYQMLNHGLSTCALFLMIGMIYDRRHTHLIEDFGGLAQVIPRYAALFMFFALSSIGLPGLNGFVGEFLILQGTFLENPGHAAFAALGIILSAIYMLWMYQRVFMGKVHHEQNRLLSDISTREIIILVPIVIMILWMGIYPGPFLRKMDSSLQLVVDRIEQSRESESYRVELIGN